MEDYLNFSKIEDELNFSKLEDSLRKSEDNLNFLKSGRQTKLQSQPS
jgi:hypothetical protein